MSLTDFRTNPDTISPLDDTMTSTQLASAALLFSHDSNVPPMRSAVSTTTVGDDDDDSEPLAFVTTLAPTQPAPRTTLATDAAQETFEKHGGHFVSSQGDARRLNANAINSIPLALRPFLTFEYVHRGVNFGPAVMIAGPRHKLWRVNPFAFKAVWLFSLNCGVVLSPIVTVDTHWDTSVLRWRSDAALGAFLLAVGGRNMASLTFSAYTLLINTLMDNAAIFTYTGLPEPEARNTVIPSAALKRVAAMRRRAMIADDKPRTERVHLPSGPVDVELPTAQPYGERSVVFSKTPLPAEITDGVDPKDELAMAKCSTYRTAKSYVAVLASLGFPPGKNRSGSELLCLSDGAWNTIKPTASNKTGKGSYGIPADAHGSPVNRASAGTLSQVVKDFIFPSVAAASTTQKKRKAKSTAVISLLSDDEADIDDFQAPPVAKKSKSHRPKPTPTHDPDADVDDKAEKRAANTILSINERSKDEARLAMEKQKRLAIERSLATARSQLQATNPDLAAQLASNLSSATSHDSSDGIARASLDFIAASTSSLVAQSMLPIAIVDRALPEPVDRTPQGLVGATTALIDDSVRDVAVASTSSLAVESMLVSAPRERSRVASPEPVDDRSLDVEVPFKVNDTKLQRIKQLLEDATTTAYVRQLLASQFELCAFVAAGESGTTTLHVPAHMVPNTSFVGVIAGVKGSRKRSDLTKLQWFRFGVVEGVERLIKYQRLPDRLGVRQQLGAEMINNLDLAPYVQRRLQPITIKGVQTMQWGAVLLKDVKAGEEIGVYGASFLPGGDAQLDGRAVAAMLAGASAAEATDRYVVGRVKHSATSAWGAASAAGQEHFNSVLSSANHSSTDANAAFRSVYDADRKGVPVFMLKAAKKGDAVLFDYGDDYVQQSELLGESMSGEVGAPSSEPPCPASAYVDATADEAKSAGDSRSSMATDDAESSHGFSALLDDSAACFDASFSDTTALFGGSKLDSAAPPSFDAILGDIGISSFAGTRLAATNWDDLMKPSKPLLFDALDFQTDLASDLQFENQ